MTLHNSIRTEHAGQGSAARFRQRQQPVNWREGKTQLQGIIDEVITVRSWGVGFSLISLFANLRYHLSPLLLLLYAISSRHSFISFFVSFGTAPAWWFEAAGAWREVRAASYLCQWLKRLFNNITAAAKRPWSFIYDVHSRVHWNAEWKPWHHSPCPPPPQSR